MNKSVEGGGQPLGLNQEQLLVSREWMERFADAPPPALLATGLTLRGRLNQDALKRAVNGLVDRHAALRVTFQPSPEIGAPERDHRLQQFSRGIFAPGLFKQFVSSAAQATLQRVDLTHLRPLQAEETLRANLQEELGRSFDYGRPPLLRATLFARGPEEHLLVLIVDHTVIDAWSMRVLRRDLVILYERYCGDTQRALPESGLSYPDYAAWQTEAMASSGFAPSVAYWQQQWRQYGSHRIGLGDLPFALPAPQRTTLSFGMERVDVPAATCASIRTFARFSRVSLNMFFLAAYAALLQFYNQKSQLALWSHFANRSRPDIQNTVGHFTHTHLIGLDFSTDPTGTQLLWQIRKVILDSYEYQEMPLAHLWRTINCWPRFADSRVLLDYHQADEPWEDWQLSSGLTISKAKLPDSPSPRFSSLGVYVKDSREGMSLSVQYSQDRFPQPAILHLLEDLQSLIAYLLKNPEGKLSDCFPSPRYRTTPGSTSNMGAFVVLPNRAAAGPAGTG